jgi:quercetin dioxygenase-like cupin family protein
MTRVLSSLFDWRSRPRPEPVRGVSSDHLYAEGGLIVALVTLDPGAVVPEHVHEHHDEVFDVMAGEGEILLDGAWRRLGAGATAIIEAGRRHALRNPGGAPWVLRETIRQRVYARAALRAALTKRVRRWLRR